MPRRLDYYFSMVSPWAYIGHATFMDLVRRHQITVIYKPVALASVFAETGGLPLAKRHPVRQRYRLFELQRWREKRKLKFELRPKYFPFDVALADRFVIATVERGLDPEAFMRKAFSAIWEEERNLADEATLTTIAADAVLPASELVAAAKSDATQRLYEQNFHDAVGADVFGSPCYVLEGEVFWGQDRLDLLNDALTSGRPPYRSDV
jgi:2-hydroxychromene-2-carboxylate isomerase